MSNAATKAIYRRWIKLIFARWLAAFHISSRGCLSLRSEITAVVSVLTKKSRGFPSIAPVAALPIRQGCYVGCLLSCAAHGNLPTDIPDKSAQFAGDRRSYFIVMNSPCSQATKTRAQSNLCFPRDRHDMLWLTFE